MPRPEITPEAEALIGQVLPCLDKGHCILLDVMGGDNAIVSAARTSYQKGTKTLREDAALINYLMRNQQMSPFEMCELKFHIKLPLFVFAQLVRHRTANLNAMSARYSEMKDEYYMPSEWRAQDAKNKQGSAGLVVDAPALDEFGIPEQTGIGMFPTQVKDAHATYDLLLKQGVAREMARMILPQNLYTEIVWKMDLRNLHHLLGLRLDGHAQAEIRVYAQAMAMCAKAAAPMAYEAFEEHHLYAVRLSRSEAEEIRRLLRGEAPQLAGRAAQNIEARLWGVEGAPPDLGAPLAALRELVTLKEAHDAGMEAQTAARYDERKPAAWANARAIVAAHSPTPPGPAAGEEGAAE